MCHSWEHEACDRVEVRIQMIQLIHVKSHLPLFLQVAVNIIQMILQQHKGAAGIAVLPKMPVSFCCDSKVSITDELTVLSKILH